MSNPLMKNDDTVFISHVKLIKSWQVLVRLIVTEIYPLRSAIYQINSSTEIREINRAIKNFYQV